MATKPASVDHYITSFPRDIQKRMEEIRGIIHKVIPAVEEKISYGIAGFFLDGKYVVYFAGYKNHIGLYPIPTGHPELDKEYASFKTSGKGAIQFPHDQLLPIKLITKIVKVKLAEQKSKKG